METEGELQVRKSRIINSADLSAFIQSLDLAFITLLRCSTVRHRKARTANERDSRQQAAGGRQQAAGNKRLFRLLLTDDCDGQETLRRRR